MFKKMLILIIVFISFLLLMSPCSGSPADVMGAQRIEPVIPGVFQLIDSDRDGKAETIKFTIEVQAYRKEDFTVTGNLEGKKGNIWLAMATSIISFPWTPCNKEVELTFPTNNIIKYKISGPYRVIFSIKSGDWELPPRIAGFSPEYVWQNFDRTERICYGAITTGSQAERAVKLWAEYKALKPGKLKEISFDYDHWRVDFRCETGEILRFLVSPEGLVDVLTLNSASNLMNKAHS